MDHKMGNLFLLGELKERMKISPCSTSAENINRIGPEFFNCWASGQQRAVKPPQVVGSRVTDILKSEKNA